MRRLILGLVLAVLVTAKPELYREKEDFQYSRSSSDEGTKSGYYDAQRGNMGGNFERAHNMDTLAQHQMGGLMNQVQGELGDGSKTRSGDVFTSANSQGYFGSGQYDLSSLGSRNFQEGASYDERSRSSAATKSLESHSSSQNNARYRNSHSYDSGHTGFGGYQSSNLHDAQTAYGAGEYEHGSQSGRNSRFYTQSGYQRRNDEEHLNTNQQASNDFGRDNRQSQIRIVLRPGSRIVVPVNAQATRESHASSNYDRIENTEAESLNTDDQQTSYTSNNKPRHYESSYSYHKQWEKHDTKPVPLSTAPVNQISTNSELYDSRSRHGSQYENEDQASSQAHHRSDFNQHHQSASSSQIRNQAEFNSQQHSASSSANSNAYSQSRHNSDAANSQSANLIGSLDSKPKSYQSSYSYHKSWERQGDPYVIKPASNGAYDGEMSQRLTDLSDSQNFNSFHNYGSQHSKSRQTYMGDCVVECDPQNSHIRVGRSARNFQEQNENTFEGQETQQSQTGWQNFDLGQQSGREWENLENLGQQTQTQHTFDNLEDLGQQTQNKWDNLEDLGQKTQVFGQQTEAFGQQTQDLGQHTQDFGQQTEDLGQHTQDFGQQLQYFGQQTEDLGQEGQHTQDFGQQLQHFGQQTEDLGQEGQHTQDFGQQLQHFGQQTEDLGQQTHEFGQQTQDFGQQTQDIGQVQDFGQQVTNTIQENKDLWSLGQETQNHWNNLQGFGQQSESLDDAKPSSWNKQGQAEHTQSELMEDQQTQKKWNQVEEEQSNVNQDMYESQSANNNPVSFWDKFNINDQYSTDQSTVHHSFETGDVVQETQGIWNNLNTLTQHDKPTNNQKPLSLWDKIDSLDNEYIGTNNKNTTDFHDYFSLTAQNAHNDFHEINQFEDSTKKYNSREQQNIHNNSEKIPSTSTTTENNSISKDISTNTIDKNHQPHSNDEGRGDIGSDDLLDDAQTTTDINQDLKNKHTSDSHTVVNNNENTQTITGNEENNIMLNQDKGLILEANKYSTESSSQSTLDTHKMQIEEVPEEVHVSGTPQELKTFFNNHNFHHESKDMEQHNTQSSEGWESHHVHNFQQGFEQQNFFQQEHGSHHDSNQYNGFDHHVNYGNNPVWYFDHQQFENHNHDKDFVQQNKDWENMGMNFNNFEQHQSHYSNQDNTEQENENNDDFDLTQKNQEHFHNSFPPFGQENESELRDFSQHEGKSEFDVIPVEINQEQQHKRTYQNVNKEINQNNMNFETFHIPQHEMDGESPFIKEHVIGLAAEPSIKETTSLPELITEKPGFWKSVGNKFTNAKNKVASWFGS